MNVSAIKELCSFREAFAEGPEVDSLFVAAMEENFRVQIQQQPYIAHLARRAGMADGRLKTMEDALRIPPLFVGTMKVHGFCSVPKEQLAMVLTSSGTAGQSTQAFFDQGSLDRLQRLATSTFDAIGFRGEKPVHAFIAGYDPVRAGGVGTSWSDQQMLDLAPCLSVNWMIQWDESSASYQFPVEVWAKRFVEAAKDAPVRLLGFPAFIHQLVEEVKNLDSSFRVQPESFVLAGGGWKSHRGASMTHHDFAAFLEESIGLPAANVRDTFGMAEHGVPYNSCKFSRHHVPVFARVRVVDPLELKPLPYGEEGLLQLFTPYNLAQSNLSVLSTDLVVLGRNCPCGLPGEYIVSVRRGGIAKHRGCAIAAQDILERSRSKGETRV